MEKHMPQESILKDVLKELQDEEEREIEEYRKE